MDTSYQERLADFSSALKDAKKPFLFHDSDADGTFSYFQLKNLNSKLQATSISKTKDVQLKAFEECVSSDHDVIFFFDTPHIEEELLEHLLGQNAQRKIYYVDHHTNAMLPLVEKYSITYFNPLLHIDSKDSRPSCYWAYLISQNSKKNLPLVCIGSVSDFFLLDCLLDLYTLKRGLFDFLINIDDKRKTELVDFIKTYEFNDISVQEKRTQLIQMMWYETNLGKIRGLVDFIYKLESENIPRAVDIIRKIDFNDLIISIDAGQGFLFEDYAAFMKNHKELMKKAVDKNKTREFVIFEHKGKTSYNRQLSEELLYRIPEAKVLWLIFTKMDSEWYSCSFRSRYPYIVNKPISDSLIGLNGQGGGHDQAGGCSVNKQDFDEFKKRFVANIEEQLQH